jgi:hypothetical protein
MGNSKNVRKRTNIDIKVSRWQRKSTPKGKETKVESHTVRWMKQKQFRQFGQASERTEVATEK